MGSTKLGDGTLLYAGEFNAYDGPWATPDDMHKFSGLLRYSQGTATDGFSVTGDGLLQHLEFHRSGARCGPSRPGRSAFTANSIRPTAATPAASRCRRGWRRPTTTDRGRPTPMSSNTSWICSTTTPGTPTDPVNGDQFHQHDDRVYGGAGASRTIDGSLFGRPTETVFGVQTRYDDIDHRPEQHRSSASSCRTSLLDHVDEGNAGIYAENTVHWTDWLRTTAGWRGDYFAASVNSMLQPANSGKHAGRHRQPEIHAWRSVRSTRPNCSSAPAWAITATTRAARRSPKCPAIRRRRKARRRFWCARAAPKSAFAPRPFRISTARSVCSTCTRIPNCSSTATPATPPPGLPSQRTGIEFTNDYRPASWLHIDADLALSRARFLGFDATQAALYQSLAGYPQAQIGNAPGNYVYNAPWMVASAGITLGEKTGWFGALRWRYISSRPLTEDGVFQSPPFNVFNGAVGYRFDNGWRIQLDALNLLNSTTDQATYAYGSLLKTDSLFAMCLSGADRRRRRSARTA